MMASIPNVMKYSLLFLKGQRCHLESKIRSINIPKKLLIAT